MSSPLDRAKARARDLLAKSSERLERWLVRGQGSGTGFRVHIVCYEDVHAWILGKFALKLAEGLEELGIDADISKKPDGRAAINHHIIYYNYDGKPATTETMMITHIDTAAKLALVKSQLPAAMGVCMSKDTVDKLAAQGARRDRLCFINPAHDGIMVPRKIAVGITSKVQPSGCKREGMLLALAQTVRPADFTFRIMGAGWDAVVDELRQRGFEVEYIDHFDRDRYRVFVPALDYYLYMGEDEGSMGFVDALAAGVKTIVTPQGYHLDAPGGITHAFSTDAELAAVFAEIARDRAVRLSAVESWTWTEYARRHLALWRWLDARKRGEALEPEMLELLRALAIDA